ncbi:hypothetical protein [Sphingomonas hankookensis]|uniref:hypothetical protein n=1 Tax=Sphingomonas hankookensis TaxID=563996 RepID=UPI003D301D12
MLRRLALLAAPVAIVAMPAAAQDRTIAALEARLFPLLSAQLRSHGAALSRDPALVALAAERKARTAEGNCTPVPACLLDRRMLTDGDIATIGAALRRVDPAADPAQWPRDAAAINRLIAVYGKGEPPRYPKIDAMSLDPAAPEFAGLVLTLDTVSRGRCGRASRRRSWRRCASRSGCSISTGATRRSVTARARMPPRSRWRHEPTGRRRRTARSSSPARGRRIRRWR